MGYRSEVGILITVPARMTAESIVMALSKKWTDWHECFETSKFKENGIQFVYVHTKFDIKWYEETYEDVKATMKAIHNWKYKTGGCHYIRIGESWEDTEEIVAGDPAKYLNFYRYFALE